MALTEMAAAETGKGKRSRGGDLWSKWKVAVD